MSFGGELAYAAVPPASEEPRRGVNRLTAETGCFGNGVSASSAVECRGEFQKLRHLRHLLNQTPPKWLYDPKWLLWSADHGRR